MQRKFYFFTALFALALLGSNAVFSQKPAKRDSQPAGPKAKKPFAKTSLGKANGTMALTSEDAGQLVSLPLKIVDEKNIEYKISSYQLAYKRIGVTEDEETGKTSVQSDIAAQRFTTTPLPAVWQKNIADGLHKGEELYFFDIIVFDKQGRRFFAPELKISIL